MAIIATVNVKDIKRPRFNLTAHEYIGNPTMERVAIKNAGTHLKRAKTQLRNAIKAKELGDLTRKRHKVKYLT